MCDRSKTNLASKIQVTHQPHYESTCCVTFIRSRIWRRFTCRRRKKYEFDHKNRLYSVRFKSENSDYTSGSNLTRTRKTRIDSRFCGTISECKEGHVSETLELRRLFCVERYETGHLHQQIRKVDENFAGFGKLYVEIAEHFQFVS